MNVEAQILTILKKYQPESNTTALELTDSLGSLGIDSLGMAEALFEIEDLFGIDIDASVSINKQPTQDVEGVQKESIQFKTINDLVRIVQDYIEKKV